MNQDKRVLGRRGARGLTVEETAFVNGAINTFVCTIPLPPVTISGPHMGDGDACGPGDLDHGQ